MPRSPSYLAPTPLCLTLALGLVSPPPLAPAAEADLLLADFEGPDYGGWTSTGTAFGPGPARGTLPNQMEVTGFEGRGLVNSYFQGDGATGTLSSPPFRVQRRYINFLLGGGMHPGETCINLLLDGKVIRTATGPNDRPGGTERLDWYSWDVTDLRGREVTIEIVDRSTGGWGHINVDQIVQSDARTSCVETGKEVRIERDYLSFQIPPATGPRTQVSLIVDGSTVRSTVAQERTAAYWITWDVALLRGKTATLRTVELPSADGKCPVAESAALSSEVRGALIVVDRPYEETYRPQFHFSPKTNWTNDPNGLVYYQGEYHLFFQHNPLGINWGNMTWGHAVSSDLVRWKQLDHALHPDRMGTMFSGSAVVDREDTAGFRTGAELPLVAFYTAAGGTSSESQGQPFTQCIAYSNDRGRTWTKYHGNPVLGHVAGQNRDPKVVRHEPTKTWIMALFLDGHDFALFGSKDLKSWDRLCDIVMPGSGECPDFFELPVDGDARNTRWVFWAADGNYRLGRFDGRAFVAETEPIRSRWGANCYAAQTYSDIPPADGRRIQISWMAGGQYPGMPFNQQMSFPRELTLRTTRDGIRLFMDPVREIETIRGKRHAWKDATAKPGENLLSALEGDLWEIQLVLEPGDAKEAGIDVRGQPIRWRAADSTLLAPGGAAPLALADGAVRIRALIDRSSVEVFGDGGRVAIVSCWLPDLLDRSLALTAVGGTANVRSLEIWELRSAWR